MTPAQLHALLDVHEYVHSDEKTRKRRKVSSDPAADLAMLSMIPTTTTG